MAINALTQPPPLATPGEMLAGFFGLTAALLLAGGSVLLRWQRNRQRFTLMRASLERGMSAPQGGLPVWLASLREGVSILTLGLGLLAVGAAGYFLAASVPAPTRPQGFNAAGEAERGSPSNNPNNPPRPIQRDPGGWAGRPERLFPPPPQGDPPDPNRPGQGERPGQPGQSGRPPEDPVAERWHRAQDQAAISLIAMGSGIVLVLLGSARLLFARVERRYLAETPGEDWDA